MTIRYPYASPCLFYGRDVRLALFLFAHPSAHFLLTLVVHYADYECTASYGALKDIEKLTTSNSDAPFSVEKGFCRTARRHFLLFSGKFLEASTFRCEWSRSLSSLLPLSSAKPGSKTPQRVSTTTHGIGEHHEERPQYRSKIKMMMPVGSSRASICGSMDRPSARH